MPTALTPPAPDQLPFDAVPALSLARKVQPGGVLAHLFTAGPGWTRSLCRVVPWTAALRDPGFEPTCGDCEQVREALEAVPEGEARALDGNR